MNPGTSGDYGQRQVEAAHRVLVDLGQVLGTFLRESLVVVGGWVPVLLLPAADEPHVGSLDVDLALDASRLGEGRYAEIVQLLLDTGRYAQTERAFQLRAQVDLTDGMPAVAVDVDFLKPRGKPSRKGGRRMPTFRPLDADACEAAFIQPVQVDLAGRMISGATNHVQIRVASLADFLIMKAHALAGRDKPKDAYDLCYCLDHAPGGIAALAKVWRARGHDALVTKARRVLAEKFQAVDSFGPAQVVAFHAAVVEETRQMHARRALELVQGFLRLSSDG